MAPDIFVPVLENEDPPFVNIVALDDHNSFGINVSKSTPMGI